MKALRGGYCRKIILTFTVLLYFLAGFLLTGCWDRRELNEAAFVLGAAIDKKKDKKIELTVQVLIPRAAGGGQQGAGGGGGGGGSTPQVLVRSAIGENVADAASKLQEKFPRRIFWGHCETYIIGEKLAKEEGVREQIDFLLRHPEPRERAYLYVSHGKAADVLELKPPLERYSGEVLRRLIEMRIGVKVTVKDFEQMVTGDAGGALLPLIKILPQKHGEKKQETIAYMAGTAIFKKDKMVGQIDDKVTRGLLWLRNQTQETTITVNPRKGETISLNPVRDATKLIPEIENRKWNITVNVSAEGTILQNGSDLDIMSPEITKRVEKYAEKDIKRRIDRALKQVKEGMDVDAFGFADAFHRKYPKEWEKVKDHWEDVLPQVNVKMDVKVHVVRSGMSTTPAGLTEEEVKKR
ncbi:Ger(x)C family spore germination protein [Aneurinibacillus tyrosinisolvens]|uniref:Ger(x)C family spore germination protein n=1 Tax=Aneurinibacillus tyrosinisolvens TaxID=1443435 RepID=UPI000699FD88|nr:Ger(x)C family spore germination protein [Aneurinibacillus tyrosinisolvens]